MALKGRSPRVERFVTEYLKDLNGARAARAAGYAPGSANTQIAELVGSNRHTVAPVLAEPAAGANVGDRRLGTLTRNALLG